MVTSNEQGNNSRDERLKRIADQKMNGEPLAVDGTASDGGNASDVTVALGAVEDAKPAMGPSSDATVRLDAAEDTPSATGADANAVGTDGAKIGEMDVFDRAADRQKAIDSLWAEDAAATVPRVLQVPEISPNPAEPANAMASAPTSAIPYAQNPYGPDAYPGNGGAPAGVGMGQPESPINLTGVDFGSYVASDFSEVPQQRKRQSLKVFGITAGVLIGMALVAYIAGVVVFMGRFLPNTFIDGKDISLKTDEEVAKVLEDEVAAYKIDVTGGDFAYSATAEDLGMKVDSGGIIRSMHTDLDPWRWPLLLWQPNHDETEHMVISYKKGDLEKAVAKKVKKFNKTAKAPVNASVAFDSDSKSYTVVPEEEGEQLDSNLVTEAVTAAVADMQPTLEITEEERLKPTVYSTDEKLVESAELATGMVSAHVTLKLNGQNVYEIGGDALSDFISIKDNYEVSFDEEGFNKWAYDLTTAYDTKGSTRTYTRSDGKVITVSGGVYGWEVDSDAARNAILEAVKAGGDTEVELPCVSYGSAYSGPGERDWGNRYLDVDISEQHVRFYGADGSIIWESDCITGSPDGKHDTWEGVWTVNAKESPSTLIGYLENGEKEYETEVEYWMPFEGNGIGFHDASWQPDFGGDMYAEGYGSHGCVNLPADAAEKLYGIIDWGDVVVVHH